MPPHRNNFAFDGHGNYFAFDVMGIILLSMAECTPAFDGIAAIAQCKPVFFRWQGKPAFDGNYFAAVAQCKPGNNFLLSMAG